MNERDTIIAELQSLSNTLASIGNKNVYTAPPAYFNELFVDVMSAIATEKFINTSSSFNVPENYFDTLPNLILQKIKADNEVELETTALSKTVANIGNSNVYEVPQHYFDGLYLAPQKETGKIVSLSLWKTIGKYAAAAVFTGLLALGIYTFTTTTSKLDVATAQVIKQADEIIKKGSFEEELKTISDVDIENYITANGDDVNAALVAATASDNEALPNADDYLLDENTLTDFLKNNNLTN